MSVVLSRVVDSWTSSTTPVHPRRCCTLGVLWRSSTTQPVIATTRQRHGDSIFLFCRHSRAALVIDDTFCTAFSIAAALEHLSAKSSCGALRHQRHSSSLHLSCHDQRATLDDPHRRHRGGYCTLCCQGSDHGLVPGREGRSALKAPAPLDIGTTLLSSTKLGPP